MMFIKLPTFRQFAAAAAPAVLLMGLAGEATAQSPERVVRDFRNGYNFAVDALVETGYADPSERVPRRVSPAFFDGMQRGAECMGQEVNEGMYVRDLDPNLRLFSRMPSGGMKDEILDEAAYICDQALRRLLRGLHL